MNPDNPGLTIDQIRVQARQDSQLWFPTLHAKGAETVLVHSALGLAGETGEAVDVIKKWHRKADGGFTGLDRDKLRSECADVLIYLLHICTETGIDLQQAYDTKRAENALRFGPGSARHDGAA